MSRTIGLAATSHGPSQVRLSRRNAVSLVLFLVLLYVLLPQLGKFRTSVSVARHARLEWILIGLGLTVATYLVAAAIYWLLAKRRLRYRRTLIVQVAGAFANRLLPAGVGAISVNYEYLRKNKHSRPQAAAVVAANNSLGFVGHMLLLGGVLVITQAPFQQLTLPAIKSGAYWLITGLIIVVLIVFWFKKLRHWLWKMIRGTVQNLIGYRTHPLKVLAALLLSMVLTGLYAFCLLACMQAIGVELDFSRALIVLTFGVAVGTVAPTPGGLVGAEAGLMAGLLAYGLSIADSLAITLLYRLLTYWLALLVGSAAFSLASGKGYF